MSASDEDDSDPDIFDADLELTYDEAQVNVHIQYVRDGEVYTEHSSR